MTLADRERCQIPVLGTGVAGLAAALERRQVLVSAAQDPAATNTAWAGGIVSAATALRVAGARYFRLAPITASGCRRFRR
jgi:aspartate oxidase